ncbi:MAG: hypothetical protein MI741_09610, partial [Rhodospirillales bacterium]|nr:hypothetical protein [Rhodospirillales bacterium]
LRDGDFVHEPDDEWRNMPEFDQQDLSPYHELNVRFVNEDDYAKFARLIEQKLTPQSKSIWFPKRYQDQCNSDHVYETPADAA